MPTPIPSDHDCDNCSRKDECPLRDMLGDSNIHEVLNDVLDKYSSTIIAAGLSIALAESMADLHAAVTATFVAGYVARMTEDSREAYTDRAGLADRTDQERTRSATDSDLTVWREAFDDCAVIGD